MKKYLFLLLGFIALASPGKAQNVGFANLDTLNASETVYYYPYDVASDTLSLTFARGNLWIQLRSDSLSGATNVVNEIQYAGRVAPYNWVTQSSGTLTSNGAAAQTLIYEDAVFGGGKWRIKSVAPSGTQATKIWTNAVFKAE